MRHGLIAMLLALALFSAPVRAFEDESLLLSLAGHCAQQVVQGNHTLRRGAPTVVPCRWVGTGGGLLGWGSCHYHRNASDNCLPHDASAVNTHFTEGRRHETFAVG